MFNTLEKCICPHTDEQIAIGECDCFCECGDCFIPFCIDSGLDL